MSGVNTGALLQQMQGYQNTEVLTSAYEAGVVAQNNVQMGAVATENSLLTSTTGTISGINQAAGQAGADVLGSTYNANANLAKTFGKAAGGG